MPSKPFSKFAALATAALIGLFWFLYHGPSDYTKDAFLATTGRKHIPNYVHFVFLLEDPTADFPLEFQHYLSIYSASYHLKPKKIVLSTNAREDQIARARQGEAGKWAKLIFTMPKLEINHVKLPTRTKSGLEISHIAHKSDFVRVQVLREYGGLYLDLDVYVLRDLKPLRESGFGAVCGREAGGMMTAGAFMTKSQGKLISTWAEQMPKVFDKGWITHSNSLMTQIGEQMIAEPRELLVLDEAALAPNHWTKEAAQELLEPHSDVPSNLERLKDGLPLLPEQDDKPSWERNWKKSYAIHAFHIEELDIKVSPRSMLDRRSVLSRALYPAVKAMYDEGIISLDDE